MEEIQDRAKSDDGVTTDSDFEFEDWNDEDRQPYNSVSIPKLQPRKAASKAEWVEEIGMAEVVEKKGGIWISTGIIRGGKLYCTIEEIAFLAERGALLLVDGDGITIPLKDIYAKIANGGYGCCWKSFEAYRHLKALGYVVGRHGSPWTLKDDQRLCNSISSANASENGEEENTSIIHRLMDISITAIKPNFSIYLPNSKFRKSSPGDPNFILCLLRENPPSEAELLNIEKDYKGVSLKFCSVESGRQAIANSCCEACGCCLKIWNNFYGYGTKFMTAMGHPKQSTFRCYSPVGSAEPHTKSSSTTLITTSPFFPLIATIGVLWATSTSTSSHILTWASPAPMKDN